MRSVGIGDSKLAPDIMVGYILRYFSIYGRRKKVDDVHLTGSRSPGLGSMFYDSAGKHEKNASDIDYSVHACLFLENLSILCVVAGFMD